MSLFVKYSCGCVGIPMAAASLPGNTKYNAIVIDHCDRDREELPGLVWFFRDLRDKTFEPVSEEKDAELHRKLADQLSAGQALDQVRTMLGITSVEANLRNTERRLDEKIDTNFRMLKSK